MDEYSNFMFEATLLFIISFVISMIITLRFFIIREKNKTCCICNCNIINLVIYLIFNAVIGIIFTLPYITVNDYFIYFMELLKIDNKEYDDIKNVIKKIYKAVHYIFYLLSDTVIPYLFNVYLKNYKNKENNNKCSFFSLSIFKKAFKGLLYILIFIVICVILIVVIIIVYPEPIVNKVTENCEGWDGIVFNIRNILAFGELEYNIFFFYLYSIFISAHYLYYIRHCLAFFLCIVDPKTSMRRILKFYKIGKLIEENEKMKENNELTEIEEELIKLNEKRRNEIKNKLIENLKDSEKCCSKKYFYCFCIPKFVIDLPIGFFMIISMALLAVFDMHNTVSDFTVNDYSKIENDWEKQEMRETIKKGISTDLVMYFLISYLYNFGMIYSIIKRKYFIEYFPYIDGNHNGLAFLNLLGYITKVATPIYFLVYFPFINNNHKAIIYSYFNWYLFNLENYWQIIIKISVLLIIPILVYFGCIHTYLKDFECSLDNKHVKKGIDEAFSNSVDLSIDEMIVI